MTKGIKYTILGLFIVVFVGFLGLTFTIDSIVKSNIEQIGTKMTGTPVKVDGVSISPFSGQGTVSGFRVANPDGYAQDFALTVNNLFIELDLMSLLSNEVIVHEILLTGSSVFVEQKLTENNIREIMNHVNSVEPGETTDSGLIIEYFLLEDGTVDLYTEVGGERSARVDISRIELRDLGSADGQEATEDVIRQIAEQVSEESLRAAVQSGGEQLRNALRDLFD